MKQKTTTLVMKYLSEKNRYSRNSTIALKIGRSIGSVMAATHHLWISGKCVRKKLGRTYQYAVDKHTEWVSE